MDSVLFHPIPTAMAVVTILWAIAEAISARRARLARALVRARRPRGRR